MLSGARQTNLVKKRLIIPDFIFFNKVVSTYRSVPCNFLWSF